jgi:signal transduction histidine kinase
VLVFAPTGRDAALIESTLRQVGHAVAVQHAIDDVCRRMEADAAVLILAEEALTPHAAESLLDALAAQPSWSDFPLVVLTSSLAMHRPAHSLLRDLREHGNVTLLERPVHPVTVLSAVEAGLRARRRQYQVRNYLQERERTEERVRQAQKMEAVGQLAGGVAHEVNNMMTIVIGAGDFALAQLRHLCEGGLQRETAALRSEVEEMVKAGKRAAAITQQLLAFSRRQPRAAVLLRTDEVLPQLGKLLRQLVGAAIEVRFHIQPDLPLIRADRTQIEQVIINLVINARDAIAGAGTITIAAECVRLDDSYMARHGVAGVRDVRWVQIAVSDTGRGMDHNTQLRAFEPFFTTKPVGQGTGLGLSTVYGIVKQSGGYVWLYSEPELGTTVKIYLPEADGDPVRQEGNGGASPRGVERVLVVEDEPGVRRLARKALEGHGYSVLEARDGVDALALLARYGSAVQLVITDVVMPSMGGHELDRVLRLERPELPVLFMSGYHGQDVSDRGLIPRGASFIQKPFAPDELAHRVRAILDGREIRGRR